MTTLHGELIVAGDIVYDVSVNRGAGRVERIVNGAIECAFGKVRAIYGSDGKQRGATMVTLYWHNPVVEVPAKQDTVWQSQIEISKLIKRKLLEQRAS